MSRLHDLSRDDVTQRLDEWMRDASMDDEPSSAWLEQTLAAVTNEPQASPSGPDAWGRRRLRQVISGAVVARAAAVVLVVGGAVGMVAVANRRADGPSTNTIPTVPTTMPPETTIPTTTPAVDGPSALVLPTFPNRKLISSLSSVSDSKWFAVSDYSFVGQEWYRKLWHTSDAGVTWVDTYISDDIASGGDWVHFADPLNGWLLSNSCCLFGTHDGGATWKQIDGVIPIGDGASAPTIASAGGRVYVLADVDVRGNSAVGVMSSPVERDEFVWSGPAMGNATWGYTPWSGQLVIRGESGWAIAYGAMSSAPSTSGAVVAPPGAVRRIDGEWTAWDPPCAASMQGEQQLTTIQLPRLVLGASPSGGTVAVVCKEASDAAFQLIEAPPTGGQLRTFVSGDGGTTFVEAAQLPDGVTMTERSWILLPDDDTILLGVALDGELVVEGSKDGGKSWTVETSFVDGKDFAPVTVTPTGRIVVVAGAEARLRDDQGTWLPLSTK